MDVLEFGEEAVVFPADSGRILAGVEHIMVVMIVLVVPPQLVVQADTAAVRRARRQAT